MEACLSYVSEHDLVFLSPEGKTGIHENVIRRYFNATLRKAGLHHVSFHSVRHTNAGMRIHAGQNIKYVSSRLGHASIKITLDTYGHLFHDADFTRQQVELLENSFRLAEVVAAGPPGRRKASLILSEAVCFDDSRRLS